MNINKLRGKMVEKGVNVEKLSIITGIPISRLYRNFKAPEKITIGDAVKISAGLSLTNAEASDIFIN